MQPIVHSIFEEKTSTWQYILACPSTKEAVIIDPVLDFDQEKLKISTESAQKLLATVTSNGYHVVRLLETHAHADHLTASAYLQKSLEAPGKPRPLICIGKRIRTVQETFAKIYDIPQDEITDVFDHLFSDDEKFQIGTLSATVLHLPGHTPDHVGYLIGENVFTGDSIFNPDVGSARCDFPGGDSRTLWNSTQKLLSLPPHYRLYTGHDYPPASGSSSDGSRSRDAAPFTTVEQQREDNKHVKKGTSEDEFVRWRSERDAGLREPKLLHPALQVNARGGRLPKNTHKGGVFFKLLVDVPADMM
ncbi:beta lactamase domain, putative [Paecilomyces variotii No. 5]|uniref:Beta lactamase domain, putative n=1 Tax=Byssochlamys spectabilis (strain No. 5 / NBRC 109023) TaxID=1356009 RepID=V5FL37_BYSSN|nr:beta lactamase domain, putative [Paecilomyces variotii No. 5]